MKINNFFCDLTARGSVILLSIGWPHVLGLGNFAQSFKVKFLKSAYCNNWKIGEFMNIPISI